MRKITAIVSLLIMSSSVFAARGSQNEDTLTISKTFKVIKSDEATINAYQEVFLGKSMFKLSEGIIVLDGKEVIAIAGLEDRNSSTVCISKRQTFAKLFDIHDLKKFVERCL
jgi:hypothetical protein